MWSEGQQRKAIRERICRLSLSEKRCGRGSTAVRTARVRPVLPPSLRSILNADRLPIGSQNGTLLPKSRRVVGASLWRGYGCPFRREPLSMQDLLFEFVVEARSAQLPKGPHDIARSLRRGEEELPRHRGV